MRICFFLADFGAADKGLLIDGGNCEMIAVSKFSSRSQPEGAMTIAIPGWMCACDGFSHGSATISVGWMSSAVPLYGHSKHIRIDSQ